MTFASNIFKVLMASLLFLAIACTSAIRIAPPLQIDGTPDEQKKDPLSAAVVREAFVIGIKSETEPALASKVRDALIQGLADATKIIVARADIVEKKPDSGYDFAVIPANFYYSVEPSGDIVMSMDVSVVRLKDGKVFGMLIEGSGQPGPRPIMNWKGREKTVNISGTFLANGSYGRALNNALFYLTLDYLNKLDRRMESIRTYE
jgi:hypothetical protein